MAKHYLRKRIYLNSNRTKYCIVKLFSCRKAMQDHYKAISPEDSSHYKCDGVSIHYEKIYSDTLELSPETGQVLLHISALGAGVVSHEFLHAILWARGHKRNKKQYPIIIKNMQEEEDILHSLTLAISSFYRWYYSVEHKFKN